MIWKNKKGFTLMELILVIGLISVVIATAFNMFKFGNTAQTMAITEYDIQSQMRVAAQKINTTVRYSSALFALPEITDPSSLKGWSYITMDNIDENGYGDEIVNYVYDKNSNEPRWKKQIIVKGKEGIRYKLEFSKDYPISEDGDKLKEDKLIKFYISVKDIKADVERDISSEVEAFNSLQIVDRGRTLGKKSRILCYRTDERPLAAEAAVSMVLDRSGSMGDNLDGGDPDATNRARIEILKEKAKEMVDSFSGKSNINVNIVPFSTSANNPCNYGSENLGYDSLDGDSYDANAYDRFLNVYSDIEKIKEDINNMQPKGGTNTGDGIRRSYYNLEKYYKDNYNPETEIKNYMVILVDGVSTFYSVKKDDNSKFLLDDSQIRYSYRYVGIYPFGQWIIDGQVGGDGGKLDTNAEKYVKEIGKKLIQEEAENIGGIRVYVIGFSNVEADHGSLNTIGEATNAVEDKDKNKYFKATSDEELKSIFDFIKDDIERELWHIYGPR